LHYDDAADGTILSGGGNLTREVSYVDGSTTLTTLHKYDYRNRRQHTRGPDDVATKFTYDATDTVTAVETYADSDTDFVIDSGELRAKNETKYDARGQVYQTISYEVAGGTAGDRLTTNYWYDAAGREIKTADPNGLFTKTSYDGAGRTVANYTCYDTDETAYDDADDVTGDTVIEQDLTYYDSAGNVWLSAALRRTHTASGTGGLSVGSEPKGRPTYTAMWYDVMGRLTKTVFYGTNDDNVLAEQTDDFNPEKANVQAYTATGEGDIPEPNTSDKYIVTKIEYNDAGMSYRTYDNRNKETRKSFDDLGRTTEIVENYYDGTAAAADVDKDRITERKYDSKGRLKTLTAHNPKDKGEGTVEQQETKYVYASALDGELVTAVAYPESSSTLSDSSGYWEITAGTDHVAYTYDRLGRKVTAADQRGVVHTYEYDSAGRLSKDKVTSVPTGDDHFDGTVRRIQRSYDDMSRVEKITTYDDATSGTVLNEVKFTYNGWGRVSKSQQDHAGAVDANSPAVDYTYEDGGDGTDADYVRLGHVTYPSGPGSRRVVYHNYSSSGVGGALSRLENIADDTSGTTKYLNYPEGFIGANTFIYASYGSGIYLYYCFEGYAGFDRFDRIVEHRWVKSGTNKDRFTYGYDRNSNRLYKKNELSASHSELYHESAANTNQEPHTGRPTRSSPRATGRDSSSTTAPGPPGTSTRPESTTRPTRSTSTTTTPTRPERP